MLIYGLLIALVAFLQIIFVIFPVVTTLPFGMDSALTTVVGYVNSFLLQFPLLTIVWQLTLWYMGIKIFLIILKLALGARAPGQTMY
jgi:hypothetical protein